MAITKGNVVYFGISKTAGYGNSVDDWIGLTIPPNSSSSPKYYRHCYIPIITDNPLSSLTITITPYIMPYLCHINRRIHYQLLGSNVIPNYDEYGTITDNNILALRTNSTKPYFQIVTDQDQVNITPNGSSWGIGDTQDTLNGGHPYGNPWNEGYLRLKMWSLSSKDNASAQPKTDGVSLCNKNINFTITNIPTVNKINNKFTYYLFLYALPVINTQWLYGTSAENLWQGTGGDEYYNGALIIDNSTISITGIEQEETNKYVWIYVNNKWNKAIPWVYNGTVWKKATGVYVYNNGWKEWNNTN